MQVGVLFSNGEVFVLNKPAGMISQGPRNTALPELWELLRHHHPNANIVHRIDKFTSGLMLAGNSRQSRSYFQRNWHHITRKVYLALIKSPSWQESLVDAAIGGKTAATEFRVLERCDDVALIRCELVKNGRTHQIRRHLKKIGHPIFGDTKYKGPGGTFAREGQMLHAWQIQVKLPNADFTAREDWTTFQAPIPEDFRLYGFNWDRWDANASLPKEQIDVPKVLVRN